MGSEYRWTHPQTWEKIELLVFKALSGELSKVRKKMGEFTVKSVEPSFCDRVEIDGADWSDYRRYAADIWYVVMGESVEPVYNEKTLEKLESAYQSYEKAKVS